MTFTTAALLLSWVAIALLALGFAGLMRQLGELHRSVSTGTGPSASLAPSLSGLALPATGDLAALRPHGGGLVLFVSPGCSSCEATMTAVAEAADPGTVVVVSSGPCPASGPLAASRCVPDALPLLERLSVPGTPYLVDVGADGVIGATLLPQDANQVTDFLAGRHVPHRHPTPRPGGH